MAPRAKLAIDLSADDSLMVATRRAAAEPTAHGGTRAHVARFMSPLVPGTYTIVLHGGNHRTILVREADSGFRLGSRVLAYLSGPDNERNYVAFAHVKASGTAYLWRRFRTDSELAEAVRVLANAPPAGVPVNLLRAGRCLACGRPLTHPASIARGYGPVWGLEEHRNEKSR